MELFPDFYYLIDEEKNERFFRKSDLCVARKAKTYFKRFFNKVSL